ncbi:MAG: flagellar hook-associated protein FlgK [Hoeflea sp.]|uniref:flagellar hook-associated protein FlgK n=1 Tax=Hoeflea sp. TaxID=1940281 RepID=UPI001D22C191|nr:flagellar hook-associated protein FlgK [Hoeflea sp.]MBU4528960.1 flagellar hook-associated protein FlgK [Alphaproteobacteria bacterium]MBU4544093.1 flagellar hook-associated protein FlgK [Alphaproteobacteria bacterium]MBU4551962.1 flagellar hook-associated protein FlgK [Alphaproteobacteria bacterium]MBV1723427.1 flagellar hook-associated protein FlgK [Hoeflea sp.]MBV1760406.1 flagellar hook-associated protein FlgK [Hoeflea sp.]
MSLSSAINSAQTSLSNYATQTSILSRNISNASNADYSRRNAALATSLNGAQVVSIQRAQDEVLFRKSISSTSTASGQETLLAGLTNLKDIYGGNDYESAPATLIANMRDTLSSYAAKPGESTLAQTAIADANTVAIGLRDASAAVQDVRFQTDQEISRQVHTLNELLSAFETNNKAVYSGTQTGKDVSAELDERDSLIKKISEIIGVTTVSRTGNDMSIYTSDGITLFETVARPVTFEASSGFAAGVEGKAIYVDGVALAPGEGATTTARGSLQALLQIRDVYAPTIQDQLDEVARALIVTFAEKDQSAAALPDAPGLFTWSGGAVPSGATIVAGIAATITVNPALVQSLGGNPQLLRDGGINGAAYSSNPAGNAGFSSLLDSYVLALDSPMAFDPDAALSTSVGVLDFAADSVGWLELNRSEADTAAETREATRYRSAEALSNETGVSLDEELSMLLQLEQSYKASARLISVVDEMLKALMAAAG